MPNSTGRGTISKAGIFKLIYLSSSLSLKEFFLHDKDQDILIDLSILNILLFSSSNSLKLGKLDFKDAMQ